MAVILGIFDTGTSELGGEQLAVIQNSEVVVLQGFISLWKSMKVQSGPELVVIIKQMAVVQGWPLRGVPLYNYYVMLWNTFIKIAIVLIMGSITPQ